ncbi:MAG TPA: glycerol-3-phosphate 1-O-acyltransferase PlsY [Tepidisphaeraceae bacterium]|jgi:glycerol-3-phosphate acyltransferase PlsY
MSVTAQLLALVPIAYLVGSIPFGLIVGLAKGVDPRKAGSGNIGATNVGRLLGGRFFALVFILDLLKGLLPMLAAGYVLHGHAHAAHEYDLWLLIGFAAIAGHMFSLFLKFKGGKGVATGAGVALGIFPYFTIPAVIGLATFGLVFLISRIVSLASIIAAAVFPIAYVIVGWLMGWDIFGSQLPLLIFAALLCAMIIYRHRSNIARLRAGTENRFAPALKPNESKPPA